MFEYGSDESSDSDNDVEMFVEMSKRKRMGKRDKPVRIEGYVQVTIPNLSGEQFRMHFRMTPDIYEDLERRIGPLLMSAEGNKPTVPVRHQLLGTLWLLATPDSYRSVAERFDLAKSSLSASFMRVVRVLNDISDQVIQWPRGQRLEAVKADFNRKSAIRGIIGAIDGTHILIKAPKVDSQFYKTYKKTYAISLQAVCESKLRFTDCFAGFAGSVGDLRVLRNSDLWASVQRDQRSFFPHDEFIIGDKAYPVLNWCIPPYIDRGQLTEAQKLFNTTLSGVRSVIERAFALLKGRFRRLKFLDMNREDMIAPVILACTVLHNICLDRIDNVDDFIAEGLAIMQENVVPHQEGIPNEREGEIKRTYLCNLLARENE
ncbi:hypothetical protein ONE63_010372 [Megalurothrips usitatus]|uniref:DDE Tnp4 domain-containing protein n=1 Tax=Megalurothrips usitatus TaxID=439358 RepID=A0AAV7XIJ9_9NEOP|nr:hypothetical protein ONE63_010372 [Megalurothrips usitatus]